jgi:hypothetical protein
MMLRDTLHEDRIEEALAYLVSTDAEYAKLKADVERTKHKAKRVEALEVMCADGSAQVRKAVSESAERAVTAWNAHYDAIEAFEKLKAERDTKVMILEIWRSWNSARKQGIHV